MQEKILQEIGLTKSEITVYTALLRSGSSKVGKLIKQISLHRSRVYEALEKLIEKGLVSYVIKENIKYFESTDPDRLLTFIHEQKAKLDKKEKDIKKIISELRKQGLKNPEAEAHVFYGKEGFKTIRKDVIKQGKPLFMIGAVGKEDKFLEYFFPNFNRERIKKKIKWKILYDSEVKGEQITKHKLMETKFLPKEYSTPAVINIYANKVINVLWKGNEPVCFMVINKDIADSYRKWFEMIWKQAK